MTERPTLDELVQRARDAAVAPAAAEAYVARVVALADRAPAPPPRRAWAWLGGGLIGAAVAAAAAIVIMMSRAPTPPPPMPPAPGPIQIGDRVAIATTPGTAYRITVAEPGRTEIVVDRGELTARLYPGPSHRLVLRGGAVEAAATGTVYTLAVDGGAGRVTVHEGTVAVRDAAGTRAVPRGSTWPPSSAGSGADAAAALLAMTLAAAPPPPPPEPAPAAIDAAPSTTIDAARRPAPIATPDATAAESSLRERWRTCRLRRSQGKLDDAVRECLAIADAGDATWSPIALVESIRIELEPAANPERAVELARQMERAWPNHPLAAEARDLGCRALRQLGRADECPQPAPDAAP